MPPDRPQLALTPAADGRRLQASIGGADAGYMNLSPTPLGMRLDYVHLAPEFRGQGYGTEMYTRAMSMLPQGRLLGGGMQTDQARQVWDRLRAKGVPTTGPVNTAALGEQVTAVNSGTAVPGTRRALSPEISRMWRQFQEPRKQVRFNDAIERLADSGRPLPAGLRAVLTSTEAPLVEKGQYSGRLLRDIRSRMLARRVKQAEAAEGIPDRADFGDLSQLQPKQLLDWIVQRHQARRAGLHYDVRFGDKDKGLYSWAVRKGLPQPGQKHLAVQQPLHSHGYRSFEGEIPQGYGAGKVTKHDQGQVLLTKAGPDGIHFTTAHRRFPERYALVPTGGRDGKRQWLLINTTKTEAIPYEKKRYAKVPADDAESLLANLAPGSTVQAKLDGAASLTKLFKDHAEVVSYRARKDTGGPIVHSERVAGGRIPANVPPRLVGSVLRGELYGLNQEGKAIPPQALGGLLNSSVANSLATQQARGVKLRNMLFDVEQLGNKKVTEPSYQKRREQLQQLMRHLPSEYFHTPEEATTPEAAQALWKGIKGGTNPLTREGVVVHPPTGVPQKIKLTDDHDVHIRGFFPGQGKYQGQAVGGFNYSHEPQGPVVGEVGSGFTDETRRMMHQDPNAFIGRVAKVRAQEKLPSGALRAPSFLSLHEDYPLAPVTKTAAEASLSSMGLSKASSCGEKSQNVAFCRFLPISGDEPPVDEAVASTPSDNDCLTRLSPDCASPTIKAAALALRELRLLQPELQPLRGDSQGEAQHPANIEHGLHKVARKRKSLDLGGDAQVSIRSNTPKRDTSGKAIPGIDGIPVKGQAYSLDGGAASAGTGQGPVEEVPVSSTPEPVLGPDPIQPSLSGGENRNVLAQLLAAKAHSDQKRYRAKHALMRQLIMSRPTEFAIDSSARGIAGITHVPTGFRIHLPRPVLPTTLRRLEGAIA